MYHEFFGLVESGFSITPDPHYLFLSEQHREALAHLLYGTGTSGGFVLLTGEVGTGKTTVCRAFLEQLPDQVDVALIFNPALNGRELLQAVCAEFGIGVKGDAPSTQYLVGALNEYLLEAHAAGRNSVLMIDEAQSLSPEVLEQVRLLTNLETDKHKLLQIFLVGQPELRTILQRAGLRQIAQRITARFHLGPLKPRDTRAYVRHRLRVAGAERELFSTEALRRVHRLTGGVPRLINLLCDRALLGAYASGRRQVNRKIVDRAARELESPSRWRSELSAFAVRNAGWIALALLLLGGAAFRFDWFGSEPRRVRQEPVRAPDPVREQSAASRPASLPISVDDEPEEKVARMPNQSSDAEAFPTSSDADALRQSMPFTVPPSPALRPMPIEQEPDAVRPLGADKVASPLQETELQSVAEVQVDEGIGGDPSPEPNVAWSEVRESGLRMPLAGRSLAMQRLLARWGVDYPDGDHRDACGVARAAGIDCLVADGGWGRLVNYDRPAMLRINAGLSHRVYVVVVGLGPESATLDLGESELRVPIDRLNRSWSGDFLLLWRSAPGGERVVGRHASLRSREWLRNQLSVLVRSNDRSGLEDLVRRFQEKQDMEADAVAGPETLIRLNTVTGRAGVPRLRVAD